MDKVKIAELCHEVNKAYCEALGDTSQASWNKAPDWQRQSAVNGVDFHLQTNPTSPADSHNSWLKEKEADGWKYGEVKDAEKKEHPCFVPYEQLPKEQKAKDYIFKAICDFFKEGK
jgi:hypothetical protein